MESSARRAHHDQPDWRVDPGASAVVFDVEGTIIDCTREILESWRLALKELGFSFETEHLHPYLGMDGKEMARKLLPPSEPDKTVERVQKRAGEIYRKAFLHTVAPFPGVRPLFEALTQRGYRIALATTCDRHELRHYLKLTNVTELVDACDTGENVPHGKPHPDLLVLAMQKLLVAPEATTAVGDTPYDSEAALRANVRCIGTLGGGFSAEDLMPAGCCAVVEGPEELGRKLDALLPAQGRPGAA